MAINTTVLFNHFSWDFDVYNLAMSVFDRMDSTDEEELYECIDNVLIPTSNQWKMMMAYQTPEEANYYDAYDSFCSDLVSALHDGAIEEEDEEDDDEDDE